MVSEARTANALAGLAEIVLLSLTHLGAAMAETRKLAAIRRPMAPDIASAADEERTLAPLRALDAMADPGFSELEQRIRRHFFTQSTLD